MLPIAATSGCWRCLHIMKCSGWVATMRNLHSRCCLRCSTAILLQVPLVSFVCYGNVFTYEVDGCFAMSFLLLPFVPQLVSGKWRKKKQKGREGWHLDVVRDAYIQYLGPSNFGARLHFEFVFASCHSVFFFFCQVVNAWQYPLFSEWVWCYACVSTRCRFGDVCSGCGLFLHPCFCHMNKNVHTRCAYSFSPLNFLAWLRLPLNFQGSAEWMVQCWVIALTFFVCLFVCSSDIHARFSLFCIYFVSWLCTCHVHLRNMLWTLHDRCMSCKQVLFYNYDVFFFLFLFFHFEAGQAFWGW